MKAEFAVESTLFYPTHVPATDVNLCVGLLRPSEKRWRPQERFGFGDRFRRADFVKPRRYLEAGQLAATQEILEDDGEVRRAIDQERAQKLALEKA